MLDSIVFQPPNDPASMKQNSDLRSRLHYEVKSSSRHKVYYALFKPPVPRFDFPMVLLYSHGNAEDLGSCYYYLDRLCKILRIDVVGYDYCGYGLSGATDSGSQVQTTDKNVEEDVELMYQMLLGRGYLSHRIVIMGRSVGGGPSCYVANKHAEEIGGLILQSTFTSCLGVVSGGCCCCLPYCCMCIDKFPNAERLQNVVSCPVLVMHGTVDAVVPMENSEALVKVLLKARKDAMQKNGVALKKKRGVVPTESSVRVAGRASTQTESVVPESPAAPESLAAWEHQADDFGVALHFFDGCGHNDMETRQMGKFVEHIRSLLVQVDKYANERAP